MLSDSHDDFHFMQARKLPARRCPATDKIFAHGRAWHFEKMRMLDDEIAGYGYCRRLPRGFLEGKNAEISVKAGFGQQENACNVVILNDLQKMNVRDTVPLNED